MLYLTTGKCIQFAAAADNFAMGEETSDGKGTLHVTQKAVFQRGPAKDKDINMATEIGRDTSLHTIPSSFNHITLAYAPKLHVSPSFANSLTALQKLMD